MSIHLNLCAITLTCSALVGSAYASATQASQAVSRNLRERQVRTEHSPQSAIPKGTRMADRSVNADKTLPSKGTRTSTQVTIVSRFGYEFAQQVSPHFRVMYRDRNVPPQSVSQVCDLLEAAYEMFYADFTEAGFKLGTNSSPLPWVIFDRMQPYREFARVADGMDSRSLESYYSSRTNQVVLMQIDAKHGGYERSPKYYQVNNPSELGVSGMDMQPDVATGEVWSGMLDVRRATHEAAHQLAFNSGIQKRGVMYPLWISEGLATNFESDYLGEVGVARDNIPRARQLLRARENGRLMPLDSFVNLVDIPYGGPEIANDLYAQSWGLFHFLFKTRSGELRHYLHQLARTRVGPRDPDTMYAEFTRAFGPVSELEKPWAEFMDQLYETVP